MLEPLAHSLSHFLVIVFLVGMAGSSIVVVMTVVDDVREFFADDEEPVSVVAGLK